MSIILITPHQLKMQIAEQAKQRRLEKNLSRLTLYKKSGVPTSTIKHFETTGNINLEALLMLAMALDCLSDFASLFAQKAPISLYNLPKQRKRGRQ